jgi:hypothetical protein
MRTDAESKEYMPSLDDDHHLSKTIIRSNNEIYLGVVDNKSLVTFS